MSPTPSPSNSFSRPLAPSVSTADAAVEGRSRRLAVVGLATSGACLGGWLCGGLLADVRVLVASSVLSIPGTVLSGLALRRGARSDRTTRWLAMSGLAIGAFCLLRFAQATVAAVLFLAVFWGTWRLAGS